MMSRMLREAGADILHRPMPMTTQNPAFSKGGNWSVFNDLNWNVAVVMHRDLFCTLRSQREHNHITNEQDAFERIRKSITNIYQQLSASGKPWYPMTYESCVRRQCVMLLCERLGLEGSVKTVWADANAKHYGGRFWTDRVPLWKRPTAE